MVVKNAISMRTAKARASMARKKGLKASVFKTKGGKIKVSVTRK